MTSARLPTLAVAESSTAQEHEVPALRKPHRQHAARRNRRLGGLGVWAAIAIYILLGLAANASAWLHGPTHTMICGGCGDPGQEVWFLAWGTHALTHLTDPLRTNWINAPLGADLADNTSMPLAGAMAAPVILLFGAVAAFNVVMSFAFASSATACFFLLRRWTRTPAAFFGGLVYGFSPYMIGQGNGHLFLLLAPVPPLLLLLLDDIVLGQRLRWWVAGLFLGLVELVQLGWSLEIFADTTLLVVIGLVVLALALRGRIRPLLPHAAKAIGLGLLPVILVGAWIAHVARTGPQHVRGSAHPVALFAGISNDLFSLVVPTRNEHFSFGYAAVGTGYVALTPPTGPRLADISESGAYVGIPLLLFLLLGIWKYRHLAIVRFATVMAVVSFVMSMGSRLHVLGHQTSIPLPFALLTHLPFVDSEAAARYALLMWLFLAVMAAVVADGWLLSPLRRRRDGHLALPAVTGRLLPGALLAAAVVTLIPAWPYQIQGTTVPAWFNSAAVRQVAAGTVLLTYPVGQYDHNQAELWQAVDGLRYRIVGGEVNVPEVGSGIVGRFLDSCWDNDATRLPDEDRLRSAREEMAGWGVLTIVVPLVETNAACAVRYVQAALGAAPELQYGADIWHVDRGEIVSAASSG